VGQNTGLFLSVDGLAMVCVRKAHDMSKVFTHESRYSFSAS